MNNLSHSQYRQQIQFAADGRLDAEQRAQLATHLAACDECRAYADEIQAVEAHLSAVSIAGLVPSPSQRQRTLAAIQSRYRRYQMNKQIFSFAGTLAAVAAVALFFVLFGYIVPRQSLPGAALTETPISSRPKLTPQSTLAQELSAQAGFEVIEPGWLPDGYSLASTSYNADEHVACLIYRTPLDNDSPPRLVIAQSILDVLPSAAGQTPSYLPASDSTSMQPTIPLGGATDEQAILFFDQLDANTYCNHTGINALKALAWRDGEYNFVIFGRADVSLNGNFVTNLEMRRIAEGLTGVSTILPDAVDPERIPSIQAAQALVGFPLQQPTELPAGYEFLYAQCFKQEENSWWVTFIYHQTGGNVNDQGMLFFQRSHTAQTLEQLNLENFEAYQSVTINGSSGLYEPGLCWDEMNNQPFPNCDGFSQLLWLKDSVYYEIRGQFAKDTLLNVAESLTEFRIVEITPTLIPQTDTPRYFVRAESDHLSLQPFQLTPFPKETPTLSPGETFNLSLVEAQTLAGYDVFVPTAPLLPELHFEGASYDPNRHTVTHRYCPASSCGNGLTITQYPGGFDDLCSTFDGCRMIGMGAVVEEVRVGDVLGEYVVGVWNLTGDGPVWVHEPWLKTLRWQAGDIAFEVVYMGQPDSITQDTLVAIATNISPINAADLALPNGFNFSSTYTQPDKNIACLSFVKPIDQTETHRLVLAQTNGPLPGPESLLTADSREIGIIESAPITVGGALENGALLTYANFDPSLLCGGVSDSYSGYNNALIWQTSQHGYVLFSTVSPFNGAALTEMEMIRIAESITGIQTLSADALDPQRLPSIADAQSLVNFDLLEPSVLPANAAFTYAQYGSDSNRKWVTLNYGSIWITQSSAPTPVTGIPTYKELPEGYIQFTIHGQPALYWMGGCWTEPNGGGFVPECGAPTSITWTENGIEYTVGSTDAASLEMLSEIAESLR